MATTTAAPRNIPGPRHMRLLGWRGNALQFFRDPIAYLQMAYQTYGELAAFTENSAGWMFAFGPAYNRQLLSDSTFFYSDPFIFGPPGSAHSRLTSGLLAMNGDQHRQQRHLMLPAFHKKHVETYRDDMIAITQRLLDRWSPGRRVDVAREMRQLTLLIASKTLFGLDVPAGNSDNIGNLIRRWLAATSSGLVLIYPVDRIGTPYRRLLKLAEGLEIRIRAMIDQKRAAATAQSDVLSMLIHARDEDGASMSDAELIGQANILFVAGHETSSNALTWTLFLLTQHQHILGDVLDELDGVLHGDAPTVEQLRDLPLLERVIKESMRVLPPVCYSVRVGTGPFTLGPYLMQPGATVFFSQYITHHMHQLYPEPERFLPDRWLTIDPSPYEYLPFGAGPRMCIGATFAMMEMKIVLAIVLQRYRLTLVPGAQIDRRVKITLSPKHGMPMTVVPQDRQFARSSPSTRSNVREMVRLEA